MILEPLKALTFALTSDSRLLRIGAAAAAPSLAPTAAADLLAETLERIGRGDAVERAVLVGALARAGGDPLPGLADLLGTDAGAVGDAMERAKADRFDIWTNYLTERVAAGAIGNRTGRILQPLLSFARAGAMREMAAEHPADDRIERARSALRFWQNMSGLGGREVVQSASLDAADEALAGERIDLAIETLVNTALSAADDRVREVVRHSLPELGFAAAMPLLSVLAGGAAPAPDQRLIREFSEAGAATAADADAFPALLAGDVLRHFTDIDTAAALIGLYLGGDGEKRARAAHVLAHMGADTALPPLLWSALNQPEAADRREVGNLLDQIVLRHPSLAIQFHSVGSRYLPHDALSWVSSLARDQEGAADWSTDPILVDQIVGAAIRYQPDITGEQGVMFWTPSQAERAGAMQRSVQSIRLATEGPEPASAEVRPLYPKIDLPDFCPIGGEVTLLVSLQMEAIDGAKAVRVPIPEGENHVRLIVMVRSPAFSISPETAPIYVERTGNSTTATFRLAALEAGQHSIDIKFLLGAEIIGHCFAGIEAGEPAMAVGVEGAPRSVTTVLENVTTDALQRHGSAQAMLIVKTRRDDYLEWSFVEPGKDPENIGTSPNPIPIATRERHIKDQTEWLRSLIARNLDAEGMEGVLSQIAATGRELLEQIAPSALEERLSRLAEAAVVVIESDAHWIPWELLADSSGTALLGERFVLVRAPLVEKIPKRAKAAGASAAGAFEGGLMVIGDDIRSQRTVLRDTFGNLAQRVERLSDATLRKLKAAVANRDVIHFMCHGRRPPYYLSLAAKSGSRLVPRQVEELDIKPGALVFANACGSGEEDLLLSEFQSFGLEFYLAGARPYIGTLAPVPESEAVEFAALFYKHFALAGLPAGAAMRSARAEAQLTMQVPVWLLYCLYGNPSETRRWAA